MNKFEYLKMVVGDKNISNAEFRTLIALWNYADTNTLISRPSAKTLANDLGKSVRKTLLDISSLQDKGFIQVVEQGGGAGRATARKLLTPTKNSDGGNQCSWQSVMVANSDGGNHKTVNTAITENSDRGIHPNNQLIIQE